MCSSFSTHSLNDMSKINDLQPMNLRENNFSGGKQTFLSRNNYWNHKDVAASLLVDCSMEDLRFFRKYCLAKHYFSQTCIIALSREIIKWNIMAYFIQIITLDNWMVPSHFKLHQSVTFWGLKDQITKLNRLKSLPTLMIKLIFLNFSFFNIVYMTSKNFLPGFPFTTVIFSKAHVLLPMFKHADHQILGERYLFKVVYLVKRKFWS